MDLQNKAAIVTGSSKGIGLETTKALLEAGCLVAGWSRSGTDIEHPNFHSIKVDVGDLKSVESGYQETVQKIGDDIRVLINNAGLGFMGDFDTMPIEEWKSMFNINVDGVFYCSRQVIPNMKKQDQGHIVNIASIAGITGIEKMAGYCGTKFAVRGISHSMFKELRNYGIKVTCIYPGSTQTNFFDEIDAVTANDNMMRPQDIAETIVQVMQTHSNYHVVDVEMRPLRPKGKN